MTPAEARTLTWGEFRAFRTILDQRAREAKKQAAR